MNIPAGTGTLLQQYFDKVFVVSIPRFTERHQKVQQQLEGVAFDFFWGADKLNLDLQQAKQNGVYNEEKTIALQRQGKPLNLGELACSLSHRMVYEEMIKHNWQKVLILEDDIVPLLQNMAALPGALKELPPDWELVYLGYLKNETVSTGARIKQGFYKILSALGLMKWTYTMVSNSLPSKYSAHLKKAGFHDCTHAYAITLSAAKKLLAAQTPVVYRADDLLSHTILKGDINGFVTEPKFFDQEVFHNSNAVSEIR
ncbi:glycosyltransferase family 25 protein [Ferruginibacter sp.]